MALPAAADFTGSSITEAQFKTAIADLRDYIATMETVAPGVVAFYPKTTAPTGWLKANGAAVSRTTYAALFSAIGTAFGAGDGSTTFNLPDLRGEFIRGLDDSRGVDAGRTLSNAAQMDQNKNHAHTIGGGEHSHVLATKGNGTTGGSNIANTEQASPAANLNTKSSASHSHTVTNEGGTEARPRNIALLACIKY